MLLLENLAKEKINQLNCNKCHNKFSKFSDLELHIKKMHATYEDQERDNCVEKIVTSWRLRKHMRIHSQLFTRTCKYFKANVICPFKDLGCKFKHEVDIKATFEEKGDTSKGISDKDKCQSLENSSLVKNGYSSSFQTSTPKSINCEECKNKSECTDCIVRHTLGIPRGRMLNF